MCCVTGWLRRCTIAGDMKQLVAQNYDRIADLYFEI
jgi:hypothetical protein